MTKKIPIGLSDFKTIIEENYYFVDKSLFIKEIIDSGALVNLITRPRRFGKTLNMSMLRYFYEKTEIDNSHLFKELKIEEFWNEYGRMQGNYPVIFITLKDIKSKTWNETYNNIKKVIAKELSRHSYVLQNNTIENKKEREIFEELLDTAGEIYDYKSILKYLSEYLNKYHGQKVVILIDEYDTAINAGYVNGYYDEIIDFMKGFLGEGLKDNSSLEKAVLTGILRVAKESIFSDMNNMGVYSILEKRYSDKFGFLESEVEEIVHFYDADFELDEVKRWYNGYNIGGHTIYNPWSVLNSVDNRGSLLKPYWINTSGNEIIRDLITQAGEELKKELEDLIQGREIEKEINDYIVYKDIAIDNNSIWNFMLFSGYLKITERWLEDKELYCKLKIPNKEIEYLFEKIIKNWFTENWKNSKMEMLLKSLVTGDIKTFGKVFSDFVISSFSYFDPTGVEAEKVYHAFVLGLLLHLNNKYEVKSNRESGYGRYDIILIPKDLAKYPKGLIIEFKKVDYEENENLKIAVNEALKQIEDKKYEVELLDRGVKREDIIAVGIAFDGKKVLVKKG